MCVCACAYVCVSVCVCTCYREHAEVTGQSIGVSSLSPSSMWDHLFKSVVLTVSRLHTQSSPWPCSFVLDSSKGGGLSVSLTKHTRPTPWWEQSSKNEDRVRISKERISQAGPPQTRMARGMYWENKRSLHRKDSPSRAHTAEHAQFVIIRVTKTSRWECLWVENLALY